MASKKVLIVYAHQSGASFNAAAKDAAVEVLSAQGCAVEVSDLYAIKFRAAATAEDVGEVKNPQHFRYSEETKLAWEEGKLSADIMEEQRKLKEAELVIFQVTSEGSLLSLQHLLTGLHFQFPMYWFSFPAILKGWIDRVLTLGFAFSPEKRFSEGVFKDKRALLSFTTGSQQSMFSSNGINGDMNVTLWPMQNGILHYCGFQVLAPQIFWAPSDSSAEARAAMLESWRKRLAGVFGDAPLTFTPLECFDVKAGFQLKPDVQEKHAGREFGLTAGVHLGKPLPPHSQMKAGV
ncbi:ribosyldihydronicotinamide dehydrogenase [quinone]-like isoform X1 [Synchiropus splendidus]|uniref:ribosyldihydronicotinamide dehydrogenase [quinone]-like isoform X1 n=1 Tax=Synchiropus splendidus TaxID=270530 RepID=UPI00237E3BE2|nr:ribosyldihydronicotinamide dehydrogenase [quinone]-like isoform X1 [Synchiropus splendidus]XP_053732935.1 ribosyldihydronicotinamide dehydrogenase [quinone]-like isoform X1 [Synchiropus splendidus]